MSKQDLPGDNKVHQVMVAVPGDPIACTVRTSMGACIDPFVDQTANGVLSPYELTFGTLDTYNLCAYNDQAQRLGACPTTPENVPLTCAQSGPNKGHCVDANGDNPIIGHADPAAVSIRVIFGSLISGRSAEHFACACQTADFTKGELDADGCAGGVAFSDDPFDCSACGGTDDIARGHCMDIDSNGLPDVSSLRAGAATISCVGTTDVVTPEGGGYLSLSGGQYFSSQIGLMGMGPALVVEPGEPLLANADCTVTVASFIALKSGQAIDYSNGPFRFHTDLMATLGAASSPAADADDASITDPDGEIAAAAAEKPPAPNPGKGITVAFNVPVDETTATAPGAVRVFEGPDMTGTELAIASLATAAGGTAIRATFDPAVTLTAGTTYTVIVRDTVRQGITGAHEAPVQSTYSFATKKAAM